MATKIYHNPACSTSRNALKLLQEAGEEPEVVLYLKVGWTRSQLEALFEAAGITARDAMRTRGTPAEELGLLAEDVSESAILDAMVEHPKMVERPFVTTDNGTVLCRPFERIVEVLGPTAPREFTKENGTTIALAR
ncbi:arsenate reductase (glutaredoxin) [Halocynthiibacter sp. C4]|uniref:arsenate reductase (glutaredoxin) n=1 Tax=Halocynthiibacter sp. C4 TaxID=2992758 RepID=UPI00237BA5B3|nr:arsenate reductase (glutaredoxin) [Halocynthiibacter sp. C4]MDE0590621.1 arsenate reductase (glutaredoxin) [Halocynthiibacter sp. C4]